MKILKAEASSIEKAASILKNGGLVAFPTETVYGLGGNALDDDAVQRIYAAKGRPSNNPLIIHTHSLSKVFEYCDTMDEVKKKLVEKLSSLWPGPLTLILPRAKIISRKVGTNTETVALRIPDHPTALELLKAADLPIAAPSANPSGLLSPTTAAHVMEGLGNKIDLILDGGPCRVGIESTVLSLHKDTPEILRPGSVTREEIEGILEVKVESGVSLNEFLSPGLLTKHYCPKTPLYFLAEIQNVDLINKKIGIVSFERKTNLLQAAEVVEICLSAEPLDIAHRLYAALHELDAKRLDLILIDRIPENGVGLAIMDRIKRAISLK